MRAFRALVAPLARVQICGPTVPGKTNIADPLSHLLQIDMNIVTKNDLYERVTFVEHLAPKSVSLAVIRKATVADEMLSNIAKAIATNQSISTKPYNALVDELCVVNGVVVRDSRIVIPV